MFRGYRVRSPCLALSGSRRIIGKRRLCTSGRLPDLPRTLRFSSYNVWFDEDPSTTRHRWAAIPQLLREQRADVHCLQEMLPTTLTHLDVLSKSGYRTIPSRVVPYGVVQCTTLPILDVESVPIPTHMHRTLLLVRYGPFAGGVHTRHPASLLVGTVHLESLDRNVLMRTRQLEAIAAEMRQRTLLPGTCLAMLLGDLNVCHPREEDHAELGFEDVWPRVNSKSLGHTYGVNYLDERYGPKRFDRALLVKSASSPYRMTHMSLFGGEPCATVHGVSVFPSDHLGIVVVAQL